LRAGACSHQTLGSPMLLRAVLAFPPFDKKVEPGAANLLDVPGSVRIHERESAPLRCDFALRIQREFRRSGPFPLQFFRCSSENANRRKIGGRSCTELVGLWRGIDPSLPRGAGAVARSPPKAHKHWSFRIFCLEAKMVLGYTQAVPVDPETRSRDPDTLQKM
jgi:hypothetical protein